MSVIALIVSLAAAVFAGFAWWNARQMRLYQTLHDLQMEYRSGEMMDAVRTLWWQYEHVKRDESKLMALYEEEYTKQAGPGSLHYKRRLVTHFYQHVAALYDKGMLPKEIVFEIWSEKDLRVIPNILIPIEIKIGEMLKTPEAMPRDTAGLPEGLRKLNKLYEGSKSYEAQRANDEQHPVSN